MIDISEIAFDATIKTKQQAYNAYAEAMEAGNSCSRTGDEQRAKIYWSEADQYWDMYFYWDDAEEY